MPPTTPTDADVVSLFTGYGGLDEGVRAALAALGIHAQVVAHCEHEPPSKATPKPGNAAARLLTYRYPDIPNLGDITTVDWKALRTQLRRFLILTGGFPCQDVSAAGRRAGLRPGNRSGLWSHFAYAISVLRPNLVVIENVRGLLSADAVCDLEPCPWCMGDLEHRPLRALGAVLGDLAALGFHAEWVSIPASDVKAPHGRSRVFILAWPAADTGGGELQRRGVGGVVRGAPRPGAGEGPERERDRDAARDGGAAVEDPDGSARGERGAAGPGEAPGRGPRADAGGRGDTAAADSPDERRNGARGARPGGAGSPDGGCHRADRRAAADTDGGGLGEVVHGDGAGQPDPAGGDAPAAADTGGADREGSRPEPARPGPERGDRPAAAEPVCRTCRHPEHVHDAGGFCALCGNDPECADPELGRPPAADTASSRGPDQPGGDAVGVVVPVAGTGCGDRGRAAPEGTGQLGGSPAVLAWGPYEPAIRRWEDTIGRAAPAPTRAGARGGQQLAAEFVEWMMGLPQGWVTGVPGLTRAEQLKMLGNGVVPQQAAAAVQQLLHRPGVADEVFATLREA